MSLQFLEETTEARVQLAMMSDATEEVMELLRYVDDDSPDIALLSAECNACAAKVKYMWYEGGVLTIDGYTKKMIMNLAVPVTYHLSGRLVTMCGVHGLSAQHPVVQACLGRMHCWASLALVTLQTEYPSYELCQAFTVLDLGEQRKHDLSATVFQQHLARLGKAFDIAPADLSQQLAAFKPAAAAAYASGISGAESWKVSILRKSRSAQARDALHTLLVKYSALCVSTHRIDSSFSIVQQHTRPQQQLRQFYAERDAVQVMLDRVSPELENHLIKAAQLLYVEWFGAARAPPQLPRVDTGRRRPRAQSKQAAWLAKRRRTLTAAVALAAATPEACEDRGMSAAWGGTHAAELGFQDAQQLRHRIDAYHDGTLLPEEVSHELEDAVAENDAKTKTNLQRNLQRSNRRRDALAVASRATPDFDFNGGAAFCHTSQPDKAAAWLCEMNMETALDRKPATVFVVDNTTAPGNRILWAAGLVGGCVACPWCASFIVYKRALQTPRHLWISPDFAMQSPATTAIIRALVDRARPRRWSIHNTLADFRARTERAAHAHRLSMMLGLATLRELNGMDDKRRIYTEDAVMKLILVPDPRRSVIGPADR